MPGAALGLSLLLIAAAPTTAPPPSAPTDATPPAGVQFGVEFPRRLQAARTPEHGHVTVTVTNDTDEPLHVGALAVESPLFEPGGAESSPKQVPPHRRFDYPVPIGAAICDGPATPTAVVAEVTGDDGTPPVTFRVEVDDITLVRINERECAARAVHDAAAFSLDIRPSDDDPIADDGTVGAALAVTRRGDGNEAIAVTALRGSVIIELTPAAPPPADTSLLELAPDAGGGTLDVRMRIARCDPHAVIESKKTFRMSVWVAIGETGDGAMIEVVPSAPLQQLLTEQVDACLAATTAAATAR